MNAPQSPTPAVTTAFKLIGPDNDPITFDLYLPPTPITDGVSTLPTVVFFHGGGLIIGDKTWFPSWLYNRVMSLGYAFVSANYQLLPPGTVHDVIQDIQDLFTYLDNTNIALPGGEVFRADMNRVAVAGSSSGGHCAYLAAIHCVPKPKAIFAMYAVGGSLFTPFYLQEKTKPFFMGRPLQDPTPFKQFLHPFPGASNNPISESPVVFDPVTKAPANIRMALPSLYIQLPVVLDLYTGHHEPSLTAKLRNLIEKNSNATLKDFEQAIPVSERCVFPELNVSPTWPPTMMIHGDADTAVLLSESQHLTTLLQKAGVEASLLIAPGQEHMFDIDPNSEKEWGHLYNSVKNFLSEHLGA